MKRIYLLNFLVLIAQVSIAQEIVWSKNVKSSSIGIFTTDNAGIIYDSYDFRNSFAQTPEADTIGFLLQKYDTSANVIWQKRWKYPFYLNKIVFDAQNNIFFSGRFYGNFSIDGINIKSRGDFDGMIGKMDSNGKLIWINTFGGKGFDEANGILLDEKNMRLLTVGNARDSVWIHNSFSGHVKQASFVGSFSIDGTGITNYKLFDYYPEVTYYKENKGQEIVKDKEGYFYFLEQRKGWSTDNPLPPFAGSFVTKLNAKFDTLWSKRVGYFGQSSTEGSNLSISDDGKIYLLLHHYYYRGGNGKIVELNTSGEETWSYQLPQVSSFTDLVVSGKAVYITGMGGGKSHGGPGPDTRYNYIKKIENHTIVGETIFNGESSYGFRLVKNKFSDLYLKGDYYRSFVLSADSLVTEEHTWRQFISKIRDVNCTPIYTYTEAPNKYETSYFFCPGGGTTLSSTSGFHDYHWSDGRSGQTIEVNKDGFYRVSAANANGCRSYSKFISFGENINKYPAYFTSVIYDEKTQKNVFNAVSLYMEYKYLKIYKAQPDNQWIVSDTAEVLLGDNPNRKYIYDRNSDPNQGPVTYYVSSIDICGNESPQGDVHTTMFLTVEASSSGNFLKWNKYIGFEYDKFKIYRWKEKDDQYKVITLDSTFTTFFDSTTKEQYYYQVMVQNNHYPEYFSQSNIVVVNKISTGIVDYHDDFKIDLFPNPCTDFLNVHMSEYGKGMYELITPTGLIISTGSFNKVDKLHIDLTGIPTGIYLLRVMKEGKTQFHKVIKL